MKIILVRHGETEENKKRIIQGHMPGRLSKEGIKQAERVGERLSSEHIDAIYSSDLARAADTAKEIAKHHPHIRLIFTELLREKDHGSNTGKYGYEVDWNNTPEDAEDYESMSERIKQMIDMAYEENRHGTVVFVSHGHIAKVFLNVLYSNPEEKLDEMVKLGNTAVSIFEIEEGKKHEIILLNCTRHLI